MATSHLIPFLLVFYLSFPIYTISKSTIEPCSNSDSCLALLGYTLYADLKVSEVAALFQTDPFAILATNAIDLTVPDVANHILPSGLFLRIPTRCSCSDGIRKSVSTRYKTRPVDTLVSIADSIFGGLASADQIREANAISDPAALEVGQTLVVPLPCACFNSTDNFFPAVYLSYVVRDGDSVAVIAAAYSTTVTDIMNANAMGSPVVRPGDILAIPLPACPAMFPRYASDYGLIVANGTYVITAGHCVQCSCGPGNLNLYCTPASMAVSCSSMQCSNSNLMLGNVTSKPTSAGCNVTSCNYGGFVNGSIVTKLTTSLQPRCPGQHQLPSVIQPPISVIHETFLAPSPTPIPAQAGGILPSPKSSAPRTSASGTSVEGTFALPGVSPSTGPAGSTSGSPSIYQFSQILDVTVFCLALIFLL